MNITILSIYLSSMYSFSPLLTGHNTIIKLSNFKYFTQTIFFNPLNLELNNNKFSFGLNSVLISENITKNVLGKTQEFHNTYFNTDNYTKLAETSANNELVIISDCIFHHILPGSLTLIKINCKATYITSCLFSSCKSSDGILNINSRSITISHICCSNLMSCNDINNKILFLNVDIPGISFMQFVYSTIFGNVDSKTDSSDIIFFKGSQSAARYQCLNISDFDHTSQESKSICKIISPGCLNMLMCTFSNLNSKNYILHINPQDGVKKNAHYVGQCNFINKDYDNNIYLDMQTGTQITFEKCVFRSNNNIFSGNNNNNDDVAISIQDCVFNTEPTILITMKTIDKTINPNLTPIPLAHFITASECIGVKVENAYGCNNNTCPDNRGCGEDAFSFKSGDVTYSYKFHPDIDTPKPTPTVEFSQSFKFSQSFVFSKSSKFTNSLNFAESSKFTNSLEFTESCKYTKSKMFTESSLFTQTAKFSESFIFTESLQGKITSSNLFSKSNIFTLSGVLPNIPVNNGDDSNNKSKVGMIAGIASGAAAAAIAGGIAIFFLVRKPQIPEIGNLETIDDEANVITNKNPLYNNNAEDDPFKDDFVNN